MKSKLQVCRFFRRAPSVYFAAESVATGPDTESRTGRDFQTRCRVLADLLPLLQESQGNARRQRRKVYGSRASRCGLHGAVRCSAYVAGASRWSSSTRWTTGTPGASSSLRSPARARCRRFSLGASASEALQTGPAIAQPAPLRDGGSSVTSVIGARGSLGRALDCLEPVCRVEKLNEAGELKESLQKAGAI